MASHIYIYKVYCVHVLYMLTFVYYIYVSIQDLHVTTVSTHAYLQALTNVILPVSVSPSNTA